MTTPKKLHTAEKRILHDKATEPAFSGAYEHFFQEGTYHCKGCGALLFDAASKFASHCGWPSFDNAVENAVMRVPDADGRRTEIVCAQCKGHLGHVFEGEGYTPLNTRHCVNSVILDFKPLKVQEECKATFAAGCFWGVQHFFSQHQGVLRTRCGYTHGHVENPTYAQVCTGATGHYEAVEVVFNPQEVSYEALVELFFEIHNPVQRDGQGVDIGPQYMSAVFCHDLHQKAVVEHVMGLLKDQGYVLATQLLEASVFYEAEETHQDYFVKNPQRVACHVRTARF